MLMHKFTHITTNATSIHITLECFPGPFAGHFPSLCFRQWLISSFCYTLILPGLEFHKKWKQLMWTVWYGCFLWVWNFSDLWTNKLIHFLQVTAFVSKKLILFRTIQDALICWQTIELLRLKHSSFIDKAIVNILSNCLRIFFVVTGFNFFGRSYLVVNCRMLL